MVSIHGTIITAIDRRDDRCNNATTVGLRATITLCVSSSSDYANLSHLQPYRSYILIFMMFVYCSNTISADVSATVSAMIVATTAPRNV